MKPKLKKPIPPPDLWAQMDKVRAEIRPHFGPPAGSFTRQDYEEKYKVSKSIANQDLRKMQKKGLVTKLRGPFGSCYYKPV